MKKIPGVYREAILDEASVAGMTQNDDPYCLAIMKPYRNLVPMAEERRKPIFKLTSADGAIGSHAGEKFSAAFNNTGSWHQVFYFVIPRVSRGIQPLRD